MTALTVVGGSVLTPTGRIRGDLAIEGGAITGVSPPGDEEIPSDRTLDANGAIVAPGFVDTHVHGATGRNFMMATEGAIDDIGRFLVQHGVTSVVMGTASLPADTFHPAVSALARLTGRTRSGLDVIGIHLEGPFLSQEYRGVHRTDAVRAPARDEVRSLIADLGPALRIVTLAPELPGALDAITRFRGAGVTVSLGHSGADAGTVRTAIARGATRATHLYNAVPDRTGASFVDEVLAEQGVFVEIIADGHHVAPERIAATFAEIGADRIVVVSDGSDVTGLGDGPHRRWEGTEVVVQDGQSRTPGGTLAGSVCPLDGALRTLVAAGIPIDVVLRSLSEHPARSIGAIGKGRIEPGADADLVLIDERSLRVMATVAGGRVVYLGDAHDPVR